MPAILVLIILGLFGFGGTLISAGEESGLVSVALGLIFLFGTAGA